MRLHGFGGPEALRVDDVEVEAPGLGKVRIRVGAFGLNRVEARYRSGAFVPASYPARIGYEAAGVIEAVGPEVEWWSIASAGRLCRHGHGARRVPPVIDRTFQLEAIGDVHRRLASNAQIGKTVVATRYHNG